MKRGEKISSLGKFPKFPFFLSAPGLPYHTKYAGKKANKSDGGCASASQLFPRCSLHNAIANAGCCTILLFFTSWMIAYCFSPLLLNSGSTRHTEGAKLAFKRYFWVQLHVRKLCKFCISSSVRLRNLEILVNLVKLAIFMNLLNLPWGRY